MREEMQRYFKTMFVTNVYKEGMEDTDFQTPHPIPIHAYRTFMVAHTLSHQIAGPIKSTPKPLRYHYVKGR